jgi:hypothetical protein
MRSLLIAVAVSAAMVGSAMAQNSFVIQQPGQPPTYVDHSPMGGYTIKTPGEPTQYLNENHDGSYTLQDPSDPDSAPTYIEPQNRPSSYGR